jgi:predicted transcriptional regulator
MKYLVDDGYAIAEEIIGGVGGNFGGMAITNNQIKYTLTPNGKSFVLDLMKIHE